LPDDRLYVVLKERRAFDLRHVGGGGEEIADDAVEPLLFDKLFDATPEGRRAPAADRQRHGGKRASGHLSVKGRRAGRRRIVGNRIASRAILGAARQPFAAVLRPPQSGEVDFVRTMQLLQYP